MTTSDRPAPLPGARSARGQAVIAVIHGDATALPLAAGSMDAACLDPPYGLEFMGKEWDRFAPEAPKTTAERADHMNRSTSYGPWGRRDRPIAPNDYGHRNERCQRCGKWRISSNRCQCPNPVFDYRIRDTAPTSMLAYQEWCRQWAREVLRVLKPGAHLLAFGGTRTYHRLACGIEDAGFELRDSCLDCHADPRPDHDPLLGVPGLAWVHGQGFPKAKDHLKPAWEPIVVARKPLAGTVAQNVLEHGTGGLNVDACRVGRQPGDRTDYGVDGDEGPPRREVYGQTGRVAYEPHTAGRWPANVTLSHSEQCEPAGTRKVRGANAPGPRGTLAQFGKNGIYGNAEGRHGEMALYTDPDGTETVPAWRCVEEHEETRTAVSVGPATVELETAPVADLEDLAAALLRRLRRLDSRSGGTESMPVSELENAQRPTALRGSPADCPACSRSGDAPALLVPADGQASARQLSDALGHVLGLECSQSSSPANPAPGLLSSEGDAPPSASPSHSAASRTHSHASAAHPALEPEHRSSDTGTSVAVERRDSTSVSSSGGPSDDTSGTTGRSERMCRWRRSQVGLVAQASARLIASVSVRSYSVIVAGCPVRLLDEQSGTLKSGDLLPGHRRGQGRHVDKGGYVGGGIIAQAYGGDIGGASRFFYTAKADAAERVEVDGVSHPTVKPLELTRWLVRLVTPPGGTVLDCFAGSGTTGEAAMLEGVNAVLVERHGPYLPLIRARTHPIVRRRGRISTSEPLPTPTLFDP
jgi:DNA modification methylase